MLNAGIGAAVLLLALRLPGMVLGSLTRLSVGEGTLSTLLGVASMAAGIGYARAMGTAAAKVVTPGRATIVMVSSPTAAGAAGGAPPGYVRSLLGGSPPALPAPRP
jgi:hypothetical protein